MATNRFSFVNNMSSTKKTDISQKVILDQLAAYLKKLDRAPDLIKKLKDTNGYCSGFTTLVLYSLWLEHQPQSTKERDDWTWLKQTLEKISNWDTQQDLTVLDQINFERVLSQISYYHHINSILPIDQGNIDKSFSDTQNRKLEKEYSVAGLFTIQDFFNAVEIENPSPEDPLAKKTLAAISSILKENKLVLIDSHNHAVGILRSNDVYYFYNSNSSDGVVTFPAKNAEKMLDLLKTLFIANGFKGPVDPSPLGFRVYGFDSPGKYPTHEEFLKNTQLIAGKDVNLRSNNLFSILHIAAKIGCYDSMKYYLDNVKVDVNIKEKNELTALHMLSAQHNSESLIQVLIDHDADINSKMNNGTTPLMIAAEKNCYGVAKILIVNNANVNATSLTSSTALHVSALNGHVDMVKLLLENNADPFVRANDSFKSTPIYCAAVKNQTEVVQILLEHMQKLKPDYVSNMLTNPSSAEYIKNDKIRDMINAINENTFKIPLDNQSVTYSRPKSHF